MAKLKTAANRVKVANDVLAQVNSGALKPKHLSYVELNRGIKSGSGDEQICDIFDKSKCQVCARGAMFVAAVKRFNDLKVKDVFNDIDDYDGNVYRHIDNDDPFEMYEEQFFEDQQVALIEGTFEGQQIGKANMIDDFITDSESNIFIAFIDEDYFDISAFLRIAHNHFGKNAKMRMVNIMHNIVVNKGDFVMPVEVFQKYLKGTPEFTMAQYICDRFNEVFASKE